MRTSSVWLAILVSGCQADQITDEVSEIIEAKETVACALGGSTTFAMECAIERSDGTALMLRHRDGSFRRLMRKGDGTIDTADGAEIISVKMLDDGRSEVSIGDDRYRLPATW